MAAVIGSSRVHVVVAVAVNVHDHVPGQVNAHVVIYMVAEGSVAAHSSLSAWIGLTFAAARAGK